MVSNKQELSTQQLDYYIWTMVPPSPVPPRFSPSPTSPNPHSSLLPLIRKQTRVYRRGRLKTNKQTNLNRIQQREKQRAKEKHETYSAEHIHWQTQKPCKNTKSGTTIYNQKTCRARKKRISTKAVRFQSVFSITI